MATQANEKSQHEHLAKLENCWQNSKITWQVPLTTPKIINKYKKKGKDKT